jgi:DNA-binding HxlR family transcriptional regulator
MNQEEPITKNNCIMVYAMDILGGKWRLPIMWKLHQHHVLRYNELRRELVGITNIMLTRSLRSLEESGLISRQDFNENPPRVDYRLTASGKRLIPVLEGIYRWGHERMVTEALITDRQLDSETSS